MLYRGEYLHVWPLLAALLVAPRSASADDDSVRITCDALTPEDAAQVEARTRATLLTTLTPNLSVRIQCDGATATVFVWEGERTDSATLTLTGEHPREALLAAIERALTALQQQSDVATAFPTEPTAGPSGTAPADATPQLEPVPPPPPAPLPPIEPAPPPPQVDSTPASRAPTPPRPDRPTWLVGAGLLGESWSDTFAYGARALLERRLPPWSIGAGFGWLATRKGDSFRADELHAQLFGAFEEQKTTGLHGSLGAGLSVLVVAPEPELIVRSDTTLPLAFLDLGLSRPVRLGQASLLPALGLRLFPGRREVVVDETTELALPPLCVSLFLGFGYEI